MRFRNTQTIPRIQQMPRINRDITVLRFNGAGVINYLAVGVPRRVALQPHTAACQHIGTLVADAVGKKREIAGRIEQRVIDDAARCAEGQIAQRTRKTINSDIAAAG